MTETIPNNIDKNPKNDDVSWSFDMDAAIRDSKEKDTEI